MTPGPTHPRETESSEEGQTGLLKAACELGPEDGQCWEALCLLPAPSTLLSPHPALSPASLLPGLWGRCGRAAPARWDLLPAGLLSPRIHAEFQLSEPPHFPFWFSPGQFTGHIILSKDASHVRDFRLYVPNHRWELWPKPPAPGLETGAQSLLSLCLFSWERPGHPLGRDLVLTQEVAAQGRLRRVIPSLDKHVPGAAWAWPTNSVPRTQ